MSNMNSLRAIYIEDVRALFARKIETAKFLAHDIKNTYAHYPSDIKDSANSLSSTVKTECDQYSKMLAVFEKAIAGQKIKTVYIAEGKFDGNVYLPAKTKVPLYGVVVENGKAIPVLKEHKEDIVFYNIITGECLESLTYKNFTEEEAIKRANHLNKTSVFFTSCKKCGDVVGISRNSRGAKLLYCENCLEDIETSTARKVG